MAHSELGVSTSLFGPGYEAQRDLPLLAAAGIEVVELGPHALPGLTRQQGCRETARLARDLGLRLHSVHVPFSPAEDISQLDEGARAASCRGVLQGVAIAAELGARWVVVHPSSEPIGEAEREDRLRQCRRSLQALADELPADSAVGVAVELLPRTCLGRTSAELVALLDSVGHNAIGACLDVNHGNLQEDLNDATRALGSRIVSTHISDNDGIDERHCLPGQGVIDWPALRAALAAAGYGGPLVYEVRRPTGDDASTMAAFLASVVANHRHHFQAMG